MVASIANNYDIPVYDFASEMPKDKVYWSDGVHVNEQGAKKKAELFAAFIHQEEILVKKNNIDKDE